MPGKIPKPTWIYRITHIENLAGIILSNGMFAPNHKPQNAPPYRTIHHTKIQEQRAGTRVRCGPGGNIHDYVPFYFAPSSPMLYSLQNGFVEGYDEGAEPIIYLVSTVEAITEAGCNFVFTDGHCIMAFTSYFDDSANLGEIDWPLMSSRYWNDTDDDPDRKRRRQAEFMVYKFCPWSTIIGVGVYSEQTRAIVDKIIRTSNSINQPTIKKYIKWYY